jgi:putative aldouronate transport system substrate-binding protein
VDVITSRLEAVRTEENSWQIDESIALLNGNQADGRVIAADGMPSSVYDGYEDIQNRTLYVEYISKIITGEYDLDKFDEFVDRWYKNGGEAVTERVRAWYAGKQ